MSIDSYIALNQRFPLEPINDRETNKRALSIIVELTHRENDLNVHELAYLTALSDLIGEYEAKVVKPVPRMLPRDMLQYMLDEHSLTVGSLAEETSISEKTLSRFLAGDVELYGSEIKKLAKRFSMKPEAFM